MKMNLHDFSCDSDLDHSYACLPARSHAQLGSMRGNT